VPEVKAGLEGVAVGATAISDVDGIAGKLIYRGIDIHELASKSTFEETAYLIWFGKLPTRPQLEGLKAQLAKEAPVDPAVLDELKRLPKDVAPMDALRTAVSLLHHYDPDKDDNTIEAAQRKAIRLTAQTATVAAAIERLRKGKDPVAPDPSLTYAANFVWMLNGEKPHETATRSLDIALILHADHGFNASTFAARVITSTLTDIHSAITGAVGCLKGPLHGGANEAVMKTLLSVQKQIEKGEVKDIEEWTRKALADKKLLMGFGHRVYKTDDPRSVMLRDVADKLGGEKMELARYIEATAIKVLDELKPGRRLYTNVEFYAGIVMDSCGVPRELFTPTFAASRVIGWCTHILEQAADNRLIRPSARYAGPPPPQPVPDAS